MFDFIVEEKGTALGKLYKCFPLFNFFSKQEIQYCTVQLVHQSLALITPQVTQDLCTIADFFPVIFNFLGIEQEFFTNVASLLGDENLKLQIQSPTIQISPNESLISFNAPITIPIRFKPDSSRLFQTSDANTASLQFNAHTITVNSSYTIGFIDFTINGELLVFNVEQHQFKSAKLRISNGLNGAIYIDLAAESSKKEILVKPLLDSLFTSFSKELNLVGETLGINYDKMCGVHDLQFSHDAVVIDKQFQFENFNRITVQCSQAKMNFLNQKEIALENLVISLPVFNISANCEYGKIQVSHVMNFEFNMNAAITPQWSFNVTVTSNDIIPFFTQVQLNFHPLIQFNSLINSSIKMLVAKNGTILKKTIAGCLQNKTLVIPGISQEVADFTTNTNLVLFTVVRDHTGNDFFIPSFLLTKLTCNSSVLWDSSKLDFFGEATMSTVCKALNVDLNMIGAEEFKNALVTQLTSTLAFPNYHTVEFQISGECLGHTLMITAQYFWQKQLQHYCRISISDSNTFYLVNANDVRFKIQERIKNMKKFSNVTIVHAMQ